MAKLIIAHEFSIETEDNTYTGTLSDLSKKQKKELKTKTASETKNSKELQKVFKKLDNIKAMFELADKADKYEDAIKYQKEKAALEDKLEKLIDSVGENDTESVYKVILEMSMKSDNKAEIIELAEEFGYELIFKTIDGDIAERKKGN